MKLVDSSCWVHAIRANGDTRIARRVADLVSGNAACWCPVIRLELWNGVGSENDRRLLREMEQLLPELSITDEVWEMACELASRCRESGKTCPTNDLLIAACARHHKLPLEHADKHLEMLMKL
jgi:predicted nucleic acid-binding protein